MMQVHRNLAALPAFRNAIITIGTFDGVHIGHQQIINQLKETAAEAGGETVIITFHPHPRAIVGTQTGQVLLLNTLDEKIMLLEKAGINHLVVVPFDTQFANQTAEEYCKSFLYHYFKPHTVIIGYDHRFGKGRSGDYHLLESMGASLGFAVKEIDEQVLNAVAVSSTKIRTALNEHDIATANQFLGYPYFFEGTVIQGNQLGRTIGYPTANLQISQEDKLVPANGVYAVSVKLSEAQPIVWGMMNIGIRPTINGTKQVIEVHIFDFSGDIYGQTIQVGIYAFLREEVKFTGLDALIAQLGVDAVKAKEVLHPSRYL
ncbi:bifunctional riboflavin kinase/FAD synthetase [Parasediminibacterium sp. JCM 36343]|uniref:bifunctional riboflavin kinase/FAD synthetase n=1 Tax=Parasediminibacterium sp. JCM 36343 TaxID=3374279 RepID=UPI00397CFDA7